MTQETALPTSGPQELLSALITPLLAPLGYELVHLEVALGRQKILRLFIEHADPAKGGIGIEDCAKVSRAVDEPLDALPEVNAIFKGGYELEVSSPGLDRPLRNARDFQKFRGREARIHILRPLEAEESENTEFSREHPKQVSYLGVLQGLKEAPLTPAGASAPAPQGVVAKVLLSVLKDDGGKSARSGRAKQPVRKKAEAGSYPLVAIPVGLISKAHLEPDFQGEHDQ